MISYTYVGVDISKDFFDVAIYSERGYRYSKLKNDYNGFEQLKALLKEKVHIVMEASGPYYLRLACYLYEQEIAVSVINPLVIRRFCQMRLTRAKTDRKDAKMIAEYGKAEQPILWKPQADYALKIRQMQASMDLLNKSRTGIIRQMKAFETGPVVCKEAIHAINKSRIAIEQQLGMLEDKMEQLIEQYHGQMHHRIQSIPGLGKKTSLLLIVLTGGFTKFETSKQLSSYIGLSPRIFESGTSVKGKSRITKMGMSRIRAMLYVCAWSAKRCNTACKELYERLLAKGKAKRQALIAIANKLLKQAFAIANSEMNYQENYTKNTCF